MKKNPIIARANLLAAAFLGVSLAAASTGSSHAASAQKPQFVSIGTASPGSSLYSYGVGLANLLSKKLTYSQFDAIETGGTIENINLIASGQIEMAVGSADTYYDARHGQGPFREKAAVQLGWELAPAVAQFITTEKTGIKRIEDLEGKRLSIGANGSAANVTALTILKLHGVDPSNVTLSYLGWTEAMNALADGAIDAGVVLGALPGAAVQQVGVSQPIRFVDVDPEKMKKSPLFETRVIKAGTYAGQDEDGVAPSYRQYVFLSPDLPADVAYDITKVGMENTDVLGKAHPVGRIARPIPESDANFMGGEVHPGALKYYREIGAR